MFWVLISATNILPCLVTLANDVSLKTASVYPIVHCRLGPGNGCPLKAPFKVPGVGATPRTTNVDLDQIHSGSPNPGPEWRPADVWLSSVRCQQDWGEGPRGWVHMALRIPASVLHATFPPRSQAAFAGSLGEV